MAKYPAGVLAVTCVCRKSIRENGVSRTPASSESTNLLMRFTSSAVYESGFFIRSISAIVSLIRRSAVEGSVCDDMDMKPL